MFVSTCVLDLDSEAMKYFILQTQIHYRLQPGKTINEYQNKHNFVMYNLSETFQQRHKAKMLIVFSQDKHIIAYK